MDAADLVVMWAQGDTLSGLSGSSGWVGAGLLGLVLSWLLLKHLPEKDAQIERMIVRHQSEMSAALTQERSEFTAALSQQRSEFTAALERIFRHQEAQTSSLTIAINKDLELIRHLFRQSMEKGPTP